MRAWSRTITPNPITLEPMGLRARVKARTNWAFMTSLKATSLKVTFYNGAVGRARGGVLRKKFFSTLVESI